MPYVDMIVVGMLVVLFFVGVGALIYFVGNILLGPMLKPGPMYTHNEYPRPIYMLLSELPEGDKAVNFFTCMNEADTAHFMVGMAWEESPRLTEYDRALHSRLYEMWPDKTCALIRPRKEAYADAKKRGAKMFDSAQDILHDFFGDDTSGESSAAVSLENALQNLVTHA